MSAFIRASQPGDEAHEAGHELLRVVPNSEWALPVAARLLEAGRAKEAAAVLRSVPADAGWTRTWQWGWAIRDAMLHTLGDYEQELRTAREALRRFPDSRLHLQSELKALAALGRVAEAEQRCELAMSRRPVSDGAGGWDWQPCAQAFAELRAHGHPAPARRLAERLLAWRRATVSASPEAQTQDRLRVLEDLGDWAGIEAMLHAPQRSALDEGEALRLQALVLAAKGDDAGAADAMRRYVSIVAGDGQLTPEQAFELSQVPALLGDREGALALLGMALRTGFGGRRLIHMYPAFDRLSGHPPLEAMVHPVESPTHLAMWRPSERSP